MKLRLDPAVGIVLGKGLREPVRMIPTFGTSQIVIDLALAEV
jgi:hypothetical protein